MPFYRQVVDAVRGRDIMVVAVSGEPIEVFREYLEASGLSAVNAATISLKELGVGATPAVLVVSRVGVVTGVWRGQLDPRAERGVLEAIRDK
jgi:hypothetical protein